MTIWQYARAHPVGVALTLFACLCYWVYALEVVDDHAVDVPADDQWATIGLHEKAFDGELTFADLFVQHNEQRIVFPRLLFLANGWLTGGDYTGESWLNVVFSTLSFLLVISLLMRTLKHPDQAESSNARPYSGWLLALATVAVATLIFSGVQWGTWLFGFSLLWYLQLFWLCLCVRLLYRPAGGVSTGALIAAALSAVCATFTAISGMLVFAAMWPLLIGPSLRQSGQRAAQREWARRLVHIGIWVAIAAASIAAYFVGYVKLDTTGESLLLTAWANFPKYMDHFLVMLGNPLAHKKYSALTVGAVALTLFAISVVLYFANWRRESAARMAPWIAIGSFAIGFAAVVSVGRMSTGMMTALHMRYVPTTLYLYVALVPLVLINVEILARWLRRYQPIASPLPRLLGTTCVLGAMITHTTIDGMSNETPMSRHTRLRQMQSLCLSLVSQAPVSCLPHGGGAKGTVVQRAAVLAKMNFHPFFDEASFISEPNRTTGFIDEPLQTQWTAPLTKFTALPVFGWAYRLTTRPQYVFLSYGDEPTLFDAAIIHLPRPDVVKALDHSAQLKTGWRTTVLQTMLPPGEHKITAWGYNPRDNTLERLQGGFSVAVLDSTSRATTAQ